jgi:hypothetical protein
MNTSDFIEYGRYIYLFITYNIHYINQFEKDNTYNINNNSLRLMGAASHVASCCKYIYTGSGATSSEATSEATAFANLQQKDELSLIKVIKPKIDTYANFFPSENAILKARESYFG